VRRDALGGKRGDGHRKRWEPVVRPDARRIHTGRSDASLTGCGGLAQFGAFLREEGVDAELARRFARLKSGPRVIYPIQAQMRLLIDAAVIGEDRVFGLERWAADPLFVRLAGGVVPSLDTVYLSVVALFEGLRIKKIGGRAARSKGVMFAIGLGEGEANDTSVESQGELESGGVAQDSPGAPPYAGLIVGRGVAHERVFENQGAFECAQSGVSDIEDDDFGSEEQSSELVDGHRFRAAGAGLGFGDWA